MYFLVLVDSYSGWFEIDKIEDMTSATVIKKLKRHFAVHGIPTVLLSDNGPCYKSDLFKEFARTWDFKHATWSPNYHQSNGLAEKAVRSAKHLLMKTGGDFYLDLLNLRNTPAAGNLGSPAQRYRAANMAKPISGVISYWIRSARASTRNTCMLTHRNTNAIINNNKQHFM